MKKKYSTTNSERAIKLTETTRGAVAPIEASWAPQDPRDRLYDEDATRTEKSASVARIVASFHPVFNVFILLADSFRHLGGAKAVLLWLVIGGIVASLWVYL